jgi:hypothetical protein
MKKTLPFLILMFVVLGCTKDSPNMVSLTVSITPNGAGTTDVVSGDFNMGAKIRLRAIPAEGYVFAGWGGDLQVTQNPMEVSMDSDLNVVAEFIVPDEDEDGIPDVSDECPNTPNGASTDEKGCSENQKDSDSDGISDDIDQCPETPENEEVDEQGCADSQKDGDGDGVTDDVDQCPDTEEGKEVDENGCPLAAKTYIPDDELERFLIDNGYDDVYDDYALTENIRKVETTLHVDGSGLNGYDIDDFTGLHDFDGLTLISMSFASSENIEIDGLESLETLMLRYGTSFQNITVSNNPRLTAIYCDRAGFGNFVVTQNPAMESFGVGVRCSFDSLSIYDDGTKSISGGTDMNISETLLVKNLPRLERIILGAATIQNITATEGLPALSEVSGTPQTSIGGMTLNSPNLKKLSLWRYEGWLNISDYPLLEYLTLRFVHVETDFDVSQNMELKTIYILGLSMEELDFSNNTKLTNLRLQADLKRINITKAPLLEYFFISSPLDGLDISQNPLLKSLQGPIKMPVIDLSTAPLLETLSVDGAELVSLDVSPCPLLQRFRLSSSPNLQCIQVSEEQLANIPPKWYIESHQSFSLDCN